MPSSVDLARAAVRRARRIVVLTGAGVSAESGIPTFRSNGGFWQTHRFQDLTTPAGFARDPKLVWQWYEERRRACAKALPNAGHDALVALEQRTKHFVLITQNVDGLHERAGSKDVIRLHGSLWRVRCLQCGIESDDHSELDDLSPRCQRGTPRRSRDRSRHVGPGLSRSGSRGGTSRRNQPPRPPISAKT